MEQLRAVLQQGAITLTLPEAWRTRELTLLPKPADPLEGDLRYQVHTALPQLKPKL